MSLNSVTYTRIQCAEVIPMDRGVSHVPCGRFIHWHGCLLHLQVLPEFDFSAHKYFPVVKIIWPSSAVRALPLQAWSGPRAQTVCVCVRDKPQGSYTRQDVTPGTRLENLEFDWNMWHYSGVCLREGVSENDRYVVLFQRAGQWKYFLSCFRTEIGVITDAVIYDIFVFMWMKNVQLTTVSCHFISAIFSPHTFCWKKNIPSVIPTIVNLFPYITNN